LAPLGISVAMEFPGTVGLGRDERPQLWFGAGGKPAGRLHLAFTAKNRAEVRASYEAAIKRRRQGQWRAGLAPALSSELLRGVCN
jgi:hypothetical protein